MIQVCSNRVTICQRAPGRPQAGAGSASLGPELQALSWDEISGWRLLGPSDVILLCQLPGTQTTAESRPSRHKIRIRSRKAEAIVRAINEAAHRKVLADS